MTFSWSFRVEAKEFQVSVSDNGVVKLSEWSYKSLSSIFLERYEAVWMVNLASRLLVVDGQRDVTLKFNESLSAFLAQRCSNKARRYVAISEFRRGRRKWVVMFLEGKGRSGWNELARVFQEVVSHLVKIKRERWGAGSSSYRKGVSFAKVVKKGPLGKKFDRHALVGEEIGDDEVGREASHAKVKVDGSFSKRLLGPEKLTVVRLG